MTDVWSAPDWLREAAACDRTRESPAPGSGVRAGDLYVVAPMDGSGARRVAVVLQVGIGWAEIGLVHTEQEMATDADVTVTRDRSPSGYPLVVQLDVHGPVFVCQLERAIGRLDADSESLTDASAAASALDCWRGMPVRTRLDPRREHKVEELRSLQSLSGPCASQILDGARDDDFDPELLLAARRGSKDAMRYLVRAASTRDRTSSVAAETLVREGSLTADEADPRGLDLVNALGTFLMPNARRGRRRLDAVFVEPIDVDPASERAFSAIAVRGGGRRRGMRLSEQRQGILAGIGALLPFRDADRARRRAARPARRRFPRQLSERRSEHGSMIGDLPPVPLRSWRLRNFKAVRSADIALANLNVLVGANSSGKSSLIQSILAASQAVSTPAGGTFPLNGPEVRLGEFRDLLYANAASGGEVTLGGSMEVQPVLYYDEIEAFAPTRTAPPFRPFRPGSRFVVNWHAGLRSGPRHAAGNRSRA